MGSLFTLTLSFLFMGLATFYLVYSGIFLQCVSSNCFFINFVTSTFFAIDRFCNLLCMFSVGTGFLLEQQNLRCFQKMKM